MTKKPSKNSPQRSLTVTVAHLCGIASLIIACSVNVAAAQSAIATPAIDSSLFKDGAVEQKEATYGAWHLKCQQIVKMKRRVCNLLSSVLDKDGKQVGSVLLATDDTGNPAMMIAFGWPVRLDKPLLISAGTATTSSKKKSKGSYEKAVGAAQCDGSCKFVFPADSELIVTLNRGETISLKAYRSQPIAGTPWLWPLAKGDAADFRINGQGFAQALNASTEIW